MRYVYLAAVALVLAGLVHIVVIVTVPYFAERDAWAKLSDRGPAWTFHEAARPGASQAWLGENDPNFASIACRFDLNEAALEVTSSETLPFWSVSIYDERSRNIYSFNDATAVGGRLFLIVVDPVQMARLRQNPPREAEEAVLVEAPISKGFVVVRALAPEATWQSEVNAFTSDARCARYALPELNTGPEPERTIEDARDG